MSGRRDGGLRSPISLVDKGVGWLLLCSSFPSLTRTIYSDTFVRFSLRLAITCSYLTILSGLEARTLNRCGLCALSQTHKSADRAEISMFSGLRYVKHVKHTLYSAHRSSAKHVKRFFFFFAISSTSSAQVNKKHDQQICKFADEHAIREISSPVPPSVDPIRLIELASHHDIIQWSERAYVSAAVHVCQYLWVATSPHLRGFLHTKCIVRCHTGGLKAFVPAISKQDLRHMITRAEQLCQSVF